MHTYIKYKVLDWITNNVINTLDVVALPNIYFLRQNKLPYI